MLLAAGVRTCGLVTALDCRLRAGVGAAPFPPPLPNGVVQPPLPGAYGSSVLWPMPCSTRSVGASPSACVARETPRATFFLLAGRPWLPRGPDPRSVSSLSGFLPLPQLGEVREHVFQECGRRGGRPGLDNHRGKYLPCSWSQHWPPVEDEGACSQGHVRGCVPGWVCEVKEPMSPRRPWELSLRPPSQTGPLACSTRSC